MRIEPIYLMAKPPAAVAAMIARERRRLGLGDGYGAERLHVTVMPLCDGSRLPPGAADWLVSTLTPIDIAPFEVVLDTLQGNMLMVGQGADAIVDLRRRIQERLARKGLPLQFNNKPHMSLAYGAPRQGRTRFGPIGWTVGELLLVRSLYGKGRHIEEGRIILAPKQGALFH